MDGSTGFARPEALAASRSFTDAQIASTVTPRAQELILLPTEKCNFRCTYCYEDFKVGKMSEAIQRGVENFVERRVPGLDQLRFNWFGGEPLVAKDVVLRLSRHAKALCDRYGVDFQGGLTTNGYLLDRSLFEALLGCNQNFFQITLDGWQSVHDQVRRFRNGAGTFDRIWKNLLSLREVEDSFEILIRIHVRRDNIDALPELIDQIAIAFGPDTRFRLDFEHLRDLGGEGGATVKDGVRLDELRDIEALLRRQMNEAISRYHPDVLSLEEQADRAAIQEMTASAKSRGESAGAQRASDLQSSGGNYICYAAKPNSLLVRANGKIGKCTVALYDDRNELGHLNEDGTIEIDNTKLRPWIRGLASLDVEDLGCPLAGISLYNESGAL